MTVCPSAARHLKGRSEIRAKPYDAVRAKPYRASPSALARHSNPAYTRSYGPEMNSLRALGLN